MHRYLLKKEFANCVIREWNLMNTKFDIALFFKKSERYNCLFKQGFDPLHNVVGYEYQGAETHREVVE